MQQQRRHGVTALLCSPGAKHTLGKRAAVVFFQDEILPRDGSSFSLSFCVCACVCVSAIVSAQAAMRITFTTSSGTLEKHH